MVRLRIAVALHCFGHPLKRAVQAASQTDARGLQIDVREGLKPSDLSETGRRQFLRRLEQLDLSVASVAFPTRSALYDQDRLDARLEAVREAMQFAYQLKCRVIVLRAGRIPEAGSEKYDVLRHALDDLARQGNSTGVIPAITPAGDPAEPLRDLLSEVQDGPIGVNFDPAALVISGHDPAAALRTLHGLLAHIQVRDAIRDVDGSGLEVPVGRGEVVWDELLALADDAGYQGWWTVDRTRGEDRTGDVARAVRYLQQVAMG